MNPQVAFWLQMIQQMNQTNSLGYTPQQMLQYAQQMAQISQQQQAPAGGGPQDLQSQLASILGTQAGISSLSGPANLEKEAATTSMDPNQLNQRINQFTKPLSQNLIHSVTRATTPAIAERGLATAPGMSQQIVAEALAPYELQEQQQGEQLAQSSLEPAFQYGSGLGTTMAGQKEDLATLLGLLGSSY